LSIANQIKSDGKLDMYDKPIDNVEDPTDPQDAATKNYVDTNELATPVTMTNGGTGANLTNDPGGLLYCGASTLAVLANDAGSAKFLRAGATGSPAWDTISLTAEVNGILPLSSGGSGANLTNDPGGILYCAGSVIAVLADGASGTYLKSGGTGVPSWGSPGVAAYTVGDYFEAEATTSRATGAASYTKIKEMSPLLRSGTIRIRITVHHDGQGTGKAKIYLSGATAGTERSLPYDGAPVEYSEDIAVSVGDLVQVYAYKVNGVGDATCTNISIDCANPTVSTEVTGY